MIRNVFNRSQHAGSNAPTRQSYKQINPCGPDQPRQKINLPFQQNHANLSKKSTATNSNQGAKEQPKVIISMSKKRWIMTILIHAVPILAATVILAINLQGFFIGDRFIGVYDDKSQSVALLLLQITAKLFFITSLGFIILEIVQHFLLHDESGLPLALSSINVTFTKLFSLFLPSFWSGISSFRSWKVRTGIGFLIVDCALLATVIGPAAALLLIPSITNEWPAGGLAFGADQDVSSLWPTLMVNLYGNTDSCLNPDDVELKSPMQGASKCLWYSSYRLMNSFNPRNLKFQGNLSVDDYGRERDISWSSYDVVNTTNITSDARRIWAWSGVSVSNLFTESLLTDWQLAINKSQTIQRGKIGNSYGSWGPLSRYSRYRYQKRFGTAARLTGMSAPAARLSCNQQSQNVSHSGLLYFPIVFDHGEILNGTNVTNVAYPVYVDFLGNTSVFNTTWVSKPAGVNASALLVVEYPRNLNQDLIYACSVDARWIADATQLTHTFDNQDTPLIASPGTFTNLESAFDPHGGPLEGKMSTVNLDVGWLNQLTPIVPGTGVSTLAQSLAAFFSESLKPSLVEYPSDDLYLLSLLRNVVPTLVVDGMARQSLVLLGAIPLWSDYMKWCFLEATTDPAPLLSEPVNNQSNTTEFQWSVTISGYAYSANSTGSILAIIVLINYILVAICHSVFVLFNRRTSSAWSSIPDILAVCHRSPPSKLLQNVGGGIESSEIKSLLLKLRIREGDKVDVLINASKYNPSYRKPIGYHMVEEGKKYH